MAATNRSAYWDQVRAKVIQVIEIEAPIGTGECLDDPVRGHRRYFSLDGKFLAEQSDEGMKPCE